MPIATRSILELLGFSDLWRKLASFNPSGEMNNSYKPHKHPNPGQQDSEFNFVGRRLGKRYVCNVIDKLCGI